MLLFRHTEIAPNLFFSRLISPGFLRLCSLVRCFHPLSIFAALGWAWTSMSLSLLELGADTWVQLSRGVSELPRQAKPTCPGLLAVLFRIQTRILLGIFSTSWVLEFLIKMKKNGKTTISLCYFYYLPICVYWFCIRSLSYESLQPQAAG